MNNDILIMVLAGIVTLILIVGVYGRYFVSPKK